STLPKLGSLLLPRRQDHIGHLKKRLVQAGFYQAGALHPFLGVKLIVMLVLPLLAALIPYAAGAPSLQPAMLVCVGPRGLGMVAPGLWLERRVKRRQALLRNGLPDALDMLVLCLEGGVSLVAAFQRVTGELQIVHPELGREISVIQREIQLGLSAGEALKKM